MKPRALGKPEGYGELNAWAMGTIVGHLGPM